MSHYRSILLYGFAIFAMFFGSGNLVFPIQIGYAAGDDWFVSFLGLLITGIFLPFLGLVVIKLYQGNYQAFFGEAGKVAGLLLPLFMLSLLGSFGVVPRCITVAYGSIHYLMPGISLFCFSLVFCVLTFFFCLNDHWMIKMLGRWMSPILLVALISLITIAVLQAPASADKVNKTTAFMHGFTTGYQTMDLFAAFFFSALIFNQIQQTRPKNNTREVILFAIKPCIFGALLLALIYLGFVFLGSHYAFLLVDILPELMLPRIAEHTMGNHAAFFIGIAVFLSCLTTAVALNNLYARYLCSLFKVTKDKFSWLLLATTSIAWAISLLDFRGIAHFLAPLLELTYPGVIGLTFMALLIKERKALKASLFYLTTLAMCVPMILH